MNVHEVVYFTLGHSVTNLTNQIIALFVQLVQDKVLRVY